MSAVRADFRLRVGTIVCPLQVRFDAERLRLIVGVEVLDRRWLSDLRRGRISDRQRLSTGQIFP